MSDPLEDFIRQNRSAFDDKEPGKNVWSNVAKAIPTTATARMWSAVTLWRAAAIFFMVVSIGAWLPRTFYTKNNPQTATALKEFHDVEAFYVKQITQKENLIDSFKNADGREGFTEDFRQLEAMYSVLREELKQHPSQKVKDALVLNLLVRIDLLNQQLHTLDNTQNTRDSVDQNLSI